MKKASRQAPEDAEVEARSGVIKKVFPPKAGTARGKRKAVLPKVTGKVRKTFTDDSTIVRTEGRAVSRVVGRGQPEGKS